MLPSLRRAVPLALIAAALVPATAAATVTRSSVTAPTSPTYRLYQPSEKAAGQSLRVAGTTDGAAGDLVDLTCGGTPVLRAVEVDKDGRFAAEVPYKTFPRLLCTLRAVPDKFNGKDLDPFTGPNVAITYFNPYETTTTVRDAERAVPMDYSARTAHLSGQTDLRSIAGGALEQYIWAQGAAVGTFDKDDRNAIEVDGRAAYAAADVPQFEFGGERPSAPAGYEGVQAALTLDERTGGIVVVESQRIVRCDGTDAPRPPQEHCRSLLDTGLRLDRTITFTDDHALVDIQDRWVATDGQPHRLRLVYAHGSKAERPLWRMQGEPGFTPRGYPDAVVPSGAGSVLLDTGKGFGALSYDPAPSVFAFGGTGLLSELVEQTVPAGGVLPVRRAFASGDSVIAVEQLVQRFAKPKPEIFPTPDNPPTTSPHPQPRKQCRVPSVKRGAKLNAVKRALKQAGCKPPRKVMRARSKKTRKGRVITLTRKAGAVLPEGTAIGIKVSRGR